MKTMKWVNTIAFLAMVAINLLAELLPLGGYTTGHIPDARHAQDNCPAFAIEILA